MIALMDAQDIIRDAIEMANHSPELCDQLMIVGVLEKVLAAVESKKMATQDQEHCQAAGNLRNALRYERALLHRMSKNNKLIGKAIYGGESHAYHQLP